MFLIVLIVSIVFSLYSDISAAILLLFVFDGVVFANKMSIVVVGVASDDAVVDMIVGAVVVVVVVEDVVVVVVVVVMAGSLPLPPVMFESLVLDLASTTGFGL